MVGMPAENYDEPIQEGFALPELHIKQEMALYTRATELLFGGAAGGGKSHFLRYAGFIFCSMIPGIQVYLFRRTFPDLFKNHMEGPSSFPNMLAPFIDKGVVSINYSKNRIEWANGSKIFLCHCQYEKDRFNYQGPEIHVLLMDELTLFTEKIYRYLRGRVRMVGIDIPVVFKEKFPSVTFPRILCGSNPGNIGHNWVKQTFIDPFPAGGRLFRAKKSDGGMVRRFIPSRVEDNPSLLEGDPDYLDRLSGMGSESIVKAMREGDWDIIAGGALDDVWDKRVHIIKPFIIPANWKIDRGFDWGSSKPYAVLWFAESNGEALEDGRCWPKGTLFIVSEKYGWNGNVNTGCKDTASRVGVKVLKQEEAMKQSPIYQAPYTHRIFHGGPADSSIFGGGTDGSTIASDMSAVGVTWTKGHKGPGSRKTGLEKVRELLLNAVQNPSELKGLYIFDCCPHTIRTLPTLPRDDNDPDDVDTDAEDHIYDVVRYKVAKKGNAISQQKLEGT